ncbi:hypothetical protein ACL7TT_20190 [Microbulbifer sp. 2304DJ12-6]|uniref:hypothetical protein n=1 Tax=Microbulbifer sp. 2304DJ12-6 TaxID=3233340 RepID=UPI0039B0EF4A
MNKLFSGIFVLLVASSNSFAAAPYLYDHCSVLGHGGDSSNVKGDRYVLVGSTETYRHEGKILSGAGGSLNGRTAYFFTLDGDAGSDKYSYQDFKQVAKRNIYFPNRGSNYVQINYSFKDSLISGNIIYETICKNINVQSPPTLTRKYVGSSSASVDYTVDEFSTAALTGIPVTITFRYYGDLYGRDGTAATFSSNSLTGTASVNLSIPGGDIYQIDAVISDGLYRKSVYLGSINKSGGGGGNPTCPRCNKD